MSSTDPYKVLGLSPSARPEEIRHVYKQLARRYHPDVNADPGAEDRFKELTLAFSVLTNPSRRALYDQFGLASLRVGFDPEEAGRRQAAQTSTAPNRASTARSSRRPSCANTARSSRRPSSASGTSDLVQPLEIDLGLAIRGGEVRLNSTHSGGSIPLSIPAGVAHGERLCLPGRGKVGRAGSRPGDLYVEIMVRPNPHYRREGLDLHLELPINLSEAARGASVEVPAPGGRLRLSIPPDQQGGEQLRLRGKGLRDPTTNTAGDLVVHLSIRLPPGSGKARRALDQLGSLYRGHIRQDVKL